MLDQTHTDLEQVSVTLFMNTLPDRNNRKEEGLLLAQVSEGSLHRGREAEGCDGMLMSQQTRKQEGVT